MKVNKIQKIEYTLVYTNYEDKKVDCTLDCENLHVARMDAINYLASMYSPLTSNIAREYAKDHTNQEVTKKFMMIVSTARIETRVYTGNKIDDQIWYSHEYTIKNTNSLYY